MRTCRSPPPGCGTPCRVTRPRRSEVVVTMNLPAAMSARVDELTRSRVPFVQATVVRAQEPSSARPGDRAIILADGTMEGFVGGHCAAGSVRTAALGALESGESMLLRVLPDGEDVFPESPG